MTTGPTALDCESVRRASDRLHDASILVEEEIYDAVAPSLQRELRAPVVPAGDVVGESGPTIYVGRTVTTATLPTSLVWFHAASAGVDGIVNSPLLAQDVLLTRTIGGMGERIAEYVLCRILVEAQLFETFLEQQRARLWLQPRPSRLSAQRVLVFGTGKMGHAIGTLLNKVGMLVDAVATSPRTVHPFNRVTTLDVAREALPTYNWLVVALPLTRQTRALLNADIFLGCDGAGFINVGRGETVDMRALTDALRSGRLKKAYLDVFAQEPLEQSSSWWNDEQIRLTPHIAALTDASDIIDEFLAAWRSIDAGEPPPTLVRRKRGY